MQSFIKGGFLKAVILVLLIGILFLFGCASSPAEIKEAMDPWIGQSVDNLVSTWGAPTQTTPIYGGGEVYTYIQTSSPTTYTTYYPYGNMKTEQTVQTGCRFDWFISPGGYVKSYHWEGDCVVR